MVRVRGLWLSVLLLQGCAHGVIHHDEGPVTLQAPLRALLRASLLSGSHNGTNALVAQTLRDSGHFSSLESQIGADSAVDIIFRGNPCTDGEYAPAPLLCSAPLNRPLEKGGACEA